jgi:hypothetical protein
MLSVEDAARIMAAVQLGQQLPIDTPEAEALAERLRSEMETFPPGVEVEVPGEWDIDDREELLNESLRFVLSESLIRSDLYRIVESAAAVPSITAGGSDHWKGQPRAKDGKWIDSGIDYDKWPQNSPSMWAKKKIKLYEKLIADGKYDEFMQLVPVIKSKQPNSYQKAVAKAWQNLHEVVKQNAMTPPKGSVPVPGTPAVAGWTKLGGQLGTEKGGTYIGPDGAKYYVKTPDNPARAHNEVLAFKLYELAGGNVAKSELVQVEGKTGIATKWMGSAEKSDWNAEDKKLAHSDFALHAWLNNWDAVGAGSENPMDNIKKFEGKMVLVDAGGSLEYKGMGGAGKKQFLPNAPEFDSLLNPKVNPTMAKVFGGMTKNELFESSKKLHGVTNDMIDEAVKKYHLGTDAEKQNMASILKQRRDSIVNAGLAHMQDTIAQDIDDLDDAPVVIVGQQSAKAGEPIPKPPSNLPNPKASGSLPPPPFGQWIATPSANKKLQSLYDAAAKGGVEALNKIDTNAQTKNHYAKKAHAYKQQLLAALQAGALPNPDHVMPPQAPIEPSFAESKAAQTKAENAAAAAADATATVDGKVSAKLFSNPPGFAGSKATINQKHATDMIAFARAGNKAGIQAIDVPDGTKIGEYKKKLLAEIDQIPQKKEAFKKQKAEAEAALEQAKKAQEKAASEFKAKYGTDLYGATKELTKSTTVLKEVGYWNVTHENIPVTHIDGVNIDDWDKRSPLMQKGLDSINKAPAAVRKAIIDFTGSYSGGIVDNMNFTKGKPTTAKAKNAARAVAQYSIELPEGMQLRRNYNYDPGAGNQLKPGQVIYSNSIHSTSTGEAMTGRKTHMYITVGKGVRGLPAEFFSEVKSEHEVTMGAGQRYLVTKYVPVGPDGKEQIYVLALPTGGVD